MKKPFPRCSRLAGALCLMMGGAFGSAHAALDLSGASYVTYGDANSYALQVEGVIAGSSGPGSIYYVNSTPGAIKDLIVVATGSKGGPVTTNFADMDNAMATPTSSGINFFSGIWNSTLAAFTGFLGAENPLFFFNNNQTKSGGTTDEHLAVWAQITLTGGAVTTKYYDFTNRNGASLANPTGTSSPYALFTEGGGGVFSGLGGDPSNYTSAGVGPSAGTNLATDYVLSGGAICLTVTKVPVSCTNIAAASGPIDNNLGANQAAYAIDVPELNAFLASWRTGLFTGYTDIHIDLRFGCDPNTVGTNGGVPGEGSCFGRDANNGFEQLFIGTSNTVTQVPEPGIVGLFGLAMLGLFASRRRRTV